MIGLSVETIKVVRKRKMFVKNLAQKINPELLENNWNYCKMLISKLKENIGKNF